MSSKPRMTGLLTIVTVVDVVSGNTDKLVEVLRHLTLNIWKNNKPYCEWGYQHHCVSVRHKTVSSA